MKRYAEKEMMSWFKSKNRKLSVLRGALQVGKSTLVRTFASFDIPRILEELGVIVGHSVDFDDNMPERQTIVLDAGGETVEYELVSLPLYAIGSVMDSLGAILECDENRLFD